MRQPRQPRAAAVAAAPKRRSSFGAGSRLVCRSPLVPRTQLDLARATPQAAGRGGDAQCAADGTPGLGRGGNSFAGRQPLNESIECSGRKENRGLRPAAWRKSGGGTPLPGEKADRGPLHLALSDALARMRASDMDARSEGSPSGDFGD